MNFSIGTLRPFQVAFMGVFGLLALIGLYIFATYDPASTGTANVGAVAVWGPFPREVVNPALETLKASDQGYNGVTYTFVRPENFSADLANALAAGQGPDLIILSQEQLVSEMPKLTVLPYSSISKRSFLDSYASEFELYLTDQGTYGIPLFIDPLVLYYNRSILASAGVALPPTTWEAVTGLVASLTQKSGVMVARSTIPLGGYANVTNARAILSALFLQSGTPITERRQEGVRSALVYSASGTGVNPAQSALAFYTQFADPVKSLYTWNGSAPSSRQAFLSGDLAFYPGFASEAASLKAGNPNLDFDMAPLPQPATATAKATYGLAYAFAIPKVAKNPSGAFRTAFALTAPDLLSASATRAAMAPALRGLLATPPADTYSPVFYPQALVAKGWLSPAPAATDGIFAGMILNVTSGRSSVSESLSSASQSIEAQIR